MSASRLFKCYACPEHAGKGFDFQAKEAVCPKCGNDGTDPTNRLAHMIVPQVVMHYIPPVRSGAMIGKGYIACTKKRIGGGMRATGETAVANCPACRASEEFKAADSVNAVPPEYAVPDLSEPTDEPAKAEE